MKEYRLTISREYTTEIEFKFPDDGRDHKKLLDEAVLDNCSEVWDMIAEEELSQMNVNNESWEIEELNLSDKEWKEQNF